MRGLRPVSSACCSRLERRLVAASAGGDQAEALVGLALAFGVGVDLRPRAARRAAAPRPRRTARAGSSSSRRAPPASASAARATPRPSSSSVLTPSRLAISTSTRGLAGGRRSRSAPGSCTSSRRTTGRAGSWPACGAGAGSGRRVCAAPRGVRQVLAQCPSIIPASLLVHSWQAYPLPLLTHVEVLDAVSPMSFSDHAHAPAAPHGGRCAAMVRETRLSPADLIAPLFVRARRGRARADPVDARAASTSRSTRWSRRRASCTRLGVPAVILFGLPDHKDEAGARGLRRGRHRASRRCARSSARGARAGR